MWDGEQFIVIARTEANPHNSDRPNKVLQNTDVVDSMRRIRRRTEHLARANPSMRMASLVIVNYQGWELSTANSKG